MSTKFICEIGSNHNGSLPRTIDLIHEAKRIGAWGCKFQFFDENLYAPEFKSQREKLKTWALPESFIPEIEDCCADLDIQFGCSVFSLEAVSLVRDYVDYLKIGSYESYYMDLINAVIETNKPWMISVGMLDYPGTLIAISAIADGKGNPLRVIFHCNSNYPANPQNCNLKDIQELQNIFTVTKIPIGWSDHTTEAGVLYKAVALGAEYIEFHFDLEDGQGFESQVGHCWKPSKIAEVIHNVRIGEMAEESADTGESEAAKWRTDPADGRRPLKKYRKELLENG